MAFMEISFRPVVLLNVPAREVFLLSNVAGRSGSVALAKIILFSRLCAAVSNKKSRPDGRLAEHLNRNAAQATASKSNWP
ncbi:hypothetical protein EFD55_20210 [Rhizobium pisi]|uniref:Uncharacterized protein n=1 Tax=Rhizobium pisi TaxID=574561 RepID=A0A427MVG3_9HYPH|nr:hypothetical protein EFD55_20210 [Rhizobium pisi]TCA58856.1 hypothetical protein E0J16_10850 [Rhizobium pisi]